VRALLTNALYLEDQAVLIDGFKFYGCVRLVSSPPRLLPAPRRD